MYIFCNGRVILYTCALDKLNGSMQILNGSIRPPAGGQIEPFS